MSNSKPPGLSKSRATKAKVTTTSADVASLLARLSNCGSSPTLHTQVGQRQGEAMHTSGKAGFLLYGPYEQLPAGTYRLVIQISSQGPLLDCWADVACESGEKQLVRMDLKKPLGNNDGLATANFEVAAPLSGVETRVWVSQDAVLSIFSIAILATAPASTDSAGALQGIKKEQLESGVNRPQSKPKKRV